MMVKEMKFFLNALAYFYEKPGRIKNYLSTGFITGVEVIIHHDLKLIYMLNPKVGSSSLVEMLSSIEFNSTPNLSQAQKRKLRGISYLRDTKQIIDLQSKGYKLFTFVRNPYERLISFFNSKYVLSNDGFYYGRKFALNKGMQKVKSFEDMVNKMCKVPLSLTDTHFMPQSTLCYEVFPGLSFDFIGKIESFEQGLAKILIDHDYFGKYFVKRNYTGTKDLTIYNGQGLLDKVNNYYEQDFINFNYRRLDLLEINK